ncbi:MAG: Crp/Fnr family transcriptional regulator [Candidatus Saccharimonadales bacterium]
MTTIADQLNNFLSNYPVRKLKRGHTLLFQGEVPRYVYVIKSGIVKTYNITSTGEEQIITFSTAYDIVPESWLLGGASAAFYFYEAFSDCQLYTIPKDVLIKETTSNPDILPTLLNNFMRLYVGANMHINALEQSRSSEKIVNLLHYLIMRFGEDTAKDYCKINLRLTHQTLAGMVGLTRETTAHELAKLRRDKVIDYQGKIYSVNKPKLLELRNEDDFANPLR